MRITAKSNRNVVVGNAPIHRRIRVLQHNVLHWTKARKYLLSNQYLAMAPDVILINAHGNKDDDRNNVMTGLLLLCDAIYVTQSTATTIVRRCQ